MPRDFPWPEGHDPESSVNFVAEELDVPSLSAAAVWPHLVDTSEWERYYGYMSDIVFQDGAGPELGLGARFCLNTLTFPVQAEVREFRPPSAGEPGLLAWHGRVDEGGDEEGRGLDLYHIWMIEDLPGGGVRILTQETQQGALAREIAAANPSPMLYSHQDWVKSLATTALRAAGQG
ncbi:polyketide cyclase [Sphingobium jiangsuense]|uniref:Polyketide cyclase n=1 Tax=Sphingobium jiangsuense TaxID=870476 RepID=A0A7W6FPD1_9SPHN|nr:SRPBCC domain-containing protein [Sphingobium jiangsuense]MBB3925783.1 hypothetical protein [Sphingobium jiangsuense]GLT00949.1 polyketide cyclase [Sphingobium jiangsuense]